MKKKFILLSTSIFCFLMLSIISCTKNANEKDLADRKTDLRSSKSADNVSGNGSKVAPGGGEGEIPCPPGTQAVLVYEFEQFRFHRPKYACKKGFFFCTTEPQWSIQCLPLNHRAKIVDQTAYVWARKVNGKVEFHFPLDLKNTSGYTKEDLSTFNVDDEYEIYSGLILKKGDYRVTEIQGELVVVADIL